MPPDATNENIITNPTSSEASADITTQPVEVGEPETQPMESDPIPAPVSEPVEEPAGLAEGPGYVSDPLVVKDSSGAEALADKTAPNKSLLTEEQEKWINNLSDTVKIKIIDFDPTSQEKFEKVRTVIQSKMGEGIEVAHREATSFGISGQDEIDTYVPVSPDAFDNSIAPLSELFGPPKKIYPLNRAHFITHEDGKHIDVYLINKESPSWLDGLKFENYLWSHPETLEEYRVLKESGTGLSVREYYRNKLEFINDVLGRV